MCEGEELPVLLDGALAEDVRIHAEPVRHLLVEHLPVLGIDGLPQRTLVESHTWCEVRRHNEQGRWQGTAWGNQSPFVRRGA